MDISPKQWMGETFGLYGAGYNLAWAIGPMIGGYLAYVFRLNSVFLAGSIICFVSMFIVASVSPKSRGKSIIKGIKDVIEKDGLFAAEMNFLRHSNITVKMVLVIEFVVYFLYSIKWAFIPLFMNGYSNLDVGFVFFASTIPFAIFDVLVGWISDKIGKRRLILLGLFLGSIATLLFTTSSSIISFACFAFLMGFSMTFIEPLISPSLAEFTPKRRRGTIVGIGGLAVDSAYLIGPIVGGILSKYFGFSAPFIFSSIMLFLTGILAVFLLKER
ncbi:MAG: MFS transporter [Candidatus Diapherotrites archaeon]|nr:MFS transporter [Candidatus Diapherotrites archaeon]